MTQFKYSNFDQQFTADENTDLPSVFLIYGEDYLVKQVLKSLCDRLLGEDAKQFSIDRLDGGTTSMGDIIEQVSTLSFLVPKKIIIVDHAPLFQGGQKSSDISYTSSELTHLADVISKGIADSHYLIFTTANTDKRKKIFKAFTKNGCTIDCSVPQGSRKADLDEQQKVLLNVTGQILNKTGKSIDRQTFVQLADLTGFNIDILVQNIHKLIAYTGKRKKIESTDLTAVIQRDKKDPIFNLTNALMNKDVKQSVFFLTSLLHEGYHPLQILKSIENQIRKLLLVKICASVLSRDRKIAFKAMSYNSFRQKVMPEVAQYDLKTKAVVEEENQARNDQEKSGKKQNLTDLLLAPNPKNAYPVFQLFQKSDNFSMHELQDLLIYLSDLDFRLKSSSFDVNTMIEQLLINICTQGGFVYAAKNKNRRHRF